VPQPTVSDNFDASVDIDVYRLIVGAWGTPATINGTTYQLVGAAYVFWANWLL